MLAYAATAQRSAERRSSPNLMLAIIAGHVALVAVVMSAKMDLPARFKGDPPIKITWIKPVEPPPPIVTPHLTPQPNRGLTTPRPLVPTPQPPVALSFPDPVFSDPPGGSTLGTGPIAEPTPVFKPTPVRIGAQLFTSERDLKPPYPPIKLASGEEATLKLRLTIDEAGRVVAVDPIGRADPVFLASARRHLLAHWHYKPATDDGRAVGSTMVITLRFQLDG